MVMAISIRVWALDGLAPVEVSITHKVIAEADPVAGPEAAAQARVEVIDARVQDGDDDAPACYPLGVQLVHAGLLVEDARVELAVSGWLALVERGLG